MENTLIIKTNATGDVLRTTVLLHVLPGNIFWITAAYNIPLFPENFPNLKLIPVENIPVEIFNLTFDTIINLEEDVQLAKLLTSIRTTKTIGVCWKNERMDYSPDSAEWFDMSLISKLPANVADDLKRSNNYSYQEILYRMMGLQFKGEEYIIYRNGNLTKGDQIVVGIEQRVGRTWPNKSWNGYNEVIKRLTRNNYDVKILTHRPELRQYMEDISMCSVILCGDTLAMHIAIAYRIPSIVIFNCTSPAEIYDYGTVRKIISPLLFNAFYKRERIDDVINSVPVDEVYDQITKEVHHSK
jgi:heptosyltransferase-2